MTRGRNRRFNKQGFGVRIRRKICITTGGAIETERRKDKVSATQNEGGGQAVMIMTGIQNVALLMMMDTRKPGGRLREGKKSADKKRRWQKDAGLNVNAKRLNGSDKRKKSIGKNSNKNKHTPNKHRKNNDIFNLPRKERPGVQEAG